MAKKYSYFKYLSIYLSLILSLIIFLFPAHAIGISSSKISEYPIIFEPGKELDLYFSVNGYKYEPGIIVEGDLMDYVEVSEIKEISPGVSGFSAHIKLPEYIDEPGMHFFYLGAYDNLPEGVGVGGSTRIRKEYIVIVLFDNREIRLAMDAPNMNVNQTEDITLKVNSWSKQDISSVNAEIEIIGSNHEVVKKIFTDSKPLPSASETTLKTSLDTTGFDPGTYVAKAKVFYDGESKEIEKTFNIGILTVHLIDYTRYFQEGKVNPVEVTVESGWNGKIDNVYAEAYINGSRVFKTVSESVDPWKRTKLGAFWDAKGMPLGAYDSVIRLYFDGSMKEENIRLNILSLQDYMNATGQKMLVEDSPSKIGGTLVIVLSLMVLMIVLAVVIILLMIKSKENKR